MAAPMKAAKAPIAGATGAFLKAAPEDVAGGTPEDVAVAAPEVITGSASEDVAGPELVNIAGATVVVGREALE